MYKIYTQTLVNLDHLFGSVLYFYPQEKIKISHLKNLIFLSANTIRNLKKYRTHTILEERNIYKVLSDEEFSGFDGAVRMSETLGIITKSADKKCYIIDKAKLSKECDFNDIRVENTLQVIVNEFLLLNGACNVIKKNVLFNESEIARKTLDTLLAKDLEFFTRDYNLYYNPSLSKPRNVGMPLFLDAPSDKGIVLVHGYLSAPKEVEELAKYLNRLGFKTYSVRLKGHGTVPINLEDVSWQDWYDCVNRGYSALRAICAKVFIIGFSTGGLLSLLAAANKSYNIDGIVCINPPLEINDARAKMVFGVNIWNNLLEKFKIEKGQLRYVENHSEYPQINYSRNYLHGTWQLEMLISQCESEFKKVCCPALVIQSDHDPVVNPQCAKTILDKISSVTKELIKIDSNKHVIVRGVGSAAVFAAIRDFLGKI